MSENRKYFINFILLQQAQNPKQFLVNAFLSAKSYVESVRNEAGNMNTQVLQEIMKIIGLFPNEYQVKMAYEYSCISRRLLPLIQEETNQGKQKEKKKLKIINKQQFDTYSFAEWLLHNINNIPQSNSRNNREIQKRAKSNYTHREVNGPNRQDEKRIREESKDNKNKFMVEEQIEKLSKIFHQINKLRQNNGQIPIDVEDSFQNNTENNNKIEEEEQFYKIDQQKRRKSYGGRSPNEKIKKFNYLNETKGINSKFNVIRNIPYDPDTFQLNKEIKQLKDAAEQEMKVLLQVSKGNKDIIQRIQKSIYKYKENVENENERVGIITAVNAQKRVQWYKDLQRKKEKEQNEFFKLHETDPIRAIRIDYLMQMTARPKMKFIPLVKPGSEYQKRYEKLISKDKSFFY